MHLRRPRLAFLAPSLLAASLACDPPQGAPGEGGPDDNGPAGACDLVDDCGEGDGRPNRRSELMGVWDPDGQRMIIFGGTDAVPVNCSFPTPNFLDETWAFYPRCGIWKRINGPAPTPRGRHMMAYDAAGHRALVFGGRYRQPGTTGNYTNYNDLWALDLSTDTWSDITTTNPPTARVNGAFVVHPDGSKAYLFGGNISLNGASYNPQNDLWELDLTTYEWTELSPTGTPPSRRLFMSALFDPVRNRMVIHGGADETAFANDARYFREVWAYDVATNAWQQLHDGQGGLEEVPAGRFWGEWVYDEENDKYLLFAGHDDQTLGNANDLWAYDPATNTWQLMRRGDTFNRPSNGFCDFPPDFTIVDLEAPERRNAHVLVYASGNDCPGVITAMGKTDCGASDDVHRWNVDEGRWQELSKAREGEMCLRTEPEFDCQDMCF